MLGDAYRFHFDFLSFLFFHIAESFVFDCAPEYPGDISTYNVKVPCVSNRHRLNAIHWMKWRKTKSENKKRRRRENSHKITTPNFRYIDKSAIPEGHHEVGIVWCHFFQKMCDKKSLRLFDPMHWLTNERINWFITHNQIIHLHRLNVVLWPQTHTHVTNGELWLDWISIKVISFFRLNACICWCLCSKMPSSQLSHQLPFIKFDEHFKRPATVISKNKNNP